MPATDAAAAARTLHQQTPEWYAARRGKMGASMAASALGLQKFLAPPVAAIASMLAGAGEEWGVTDTADTRWSSAMKLRARRAYEEVSGLSVSSTGLCMNDDQPWLACSPGGFVYDPVADNAGAPQRPVGLVYLKCKSPFGGMRGDSHYGLGDAAAQLSIDETKLEAARRHLRPSTLLDEALYLQVVLALHIVHAPWCDVLFWAPGWTAVVRVLPNAALVEQVLPPLARIHEAAMANSDRLRAAAVASGESPREYRSLLYALCLATDVETRVDGGGGEPAGIPPRDATGVAPESIEPSELNGDLRVVVRGLMPPVDNGDIHTRILQMKKDERTPYVNWTIHRDGSVASWRRHAYAKPEGVDVARRLVEEFVQSGALSVSRDVFEREIVRKELANVL